MVVIVDFDHGDPLISDKLWEWGARLQQEPSLAFSEAYGGFWIASRHRDVTAILHDTENFINAKGITLPPQKSPVPVIPLDADEPDHSFYRSVFTPFLTPKTVLRFEEQIRTIVVESLDAIVKRGEGDVVADFAARIPTRAMAMIFGFSEDDATRFDKGFTALVKAAGSGDASQQNAAVESFRAFLLSKIVERRANPTDTDLVSAILRHEVAGRTFTENECLGLMWSAAGGAIDTTKHAICHATRELYRHKDVRQKLNHDRKLVPLAVEESLRLNASAFMDSRYIAKDVTVSGTEMKAGGRVLLVFGWANRDPAVFPSPDEMRLDRSTNKHLTFGNGLHMCVGMHLARLEIKIAIEELLARIPNYELPILASPVLQGGMMWCFESLPIR
jgi:cytochrome P450